MPSLTKCYIKKGLQEGKNCDILGSVKVGIMF